MYSNGMPESPDDDDLVVPASSFEVKAYFREEPSRAVVKEVLDWIRETGRPHEWRGHTHTKPPAGATPKYLDEFDVPTKGRIRHAVAPCPCCSPLKPKYKRSGKIAWFPDEDVIRLIGPDCFASLNAEGHTEAVKELRLRKKREQAIRYLSDSLPRLEEAREAFKAVRSVALVMERFRSELQEALQGQQIPLWDHSNRGELSVFREEQDVSIAADGEIIRRNILVKAPYAALSGYRMLDPSAKPFDQRLANIDVGLSRMIDQVTAEPNVAEWPEVFMRQSLSSYNRTRRSFVALVDELRDLQQFVRLGVPTLRSWGRLPEATLSVYVDVAGNDLRIGLGEHSWRKALIGDTILTVLPDVVAIDPGMDAGD
jgi:hypothetical protein